MRSSLFVLGVTWRHFVYVGSTFADRVRAGVFA